MVTSNEPHVRCRHTFLSQVGEMVTLNEPHVSIQASVSWSLFKPQKINRSIYITIYNIPFNENKSNNFININIYILSSITCFRDLIQQHTHIYWQRCMQTSYTKLVKPQNINKSIYIWQYSKDLFQHHNKITKRCSSLILWSGYYKLFEDNWWNYMVEIYHTSKAFTCPKCRLYNIEN